MRRPKKRTITCDCRNFIEWYGYTLYHFCIPKDLPAKPMMRIIVWIQYFKLLFKLNEQTAQCIIWHACNLCFISFWKNRGVTVIIRSRIRSNIWMVMFLKHHNDRSGSLILDLTRKQTSGKLLDLYRTGGPVTTWKIQVLQVLQHFYRTSFFSKIRVPIEGLPTRFFLPDRRTGTAMVFNSPPLFSPVEDRGPVNFPMSEEVMLYL